jgi:hypothetical protein
MRIYDFAKEHGVDSKVVVHALVEQGVIDKPNAALGVEEDEAIEACRGTVFSVKEKEDGPGRKAAGHTRVNEEAVRDNITGITFPIGAQQSDVYSKAARIIAKRLSEEENTEVGLDDARVRNRAYRVVTRGREAKIDGRQLITPTNRPGNPLGRKSWDEEAQDHTEG